PRVEADRAHLVLGEVAALAAEANALLHVPDRIGQRLRLRFRRLEDVEREPLRGAAADPGQPRELPDEVLDGWAQHASRVLAVTAGALAADAGQPEPAEHLRLHLLGLRLDRVRGRAQRFVDAGEYEVGETLRIRRVDRVGRDRDLEDPAGAVC